MPAGEGICVVQPKIDGTVTPKPWCVIVPFTLPGEVVRVRVYRSARMHSYADLLEVVEPNAELRDMDRVQCKYFGECAGCQYQVGFIAIDFTMPDRPGIRCCLTKPNWTSSAMLWSRHTKILVVRCPFVVASKLTSVLSSAITRPTLRYRSRNWSDHWLSVTV